MDIDDRLSKQSSLLLGMQREMRVKFAREVKNELVITGIVDEMFNRVLRSVSSPDAIRAHLVELMQVSVDMALGSSPAEGRTCPHVIVDARNPVIKSGYLCTECRTLFQAGDHEG